MTSRPRAAAILAIATLSLLVQRSLHADGVHGAYVDEVEVYGGIERGAAVEYLLRSLRAHEWQVTVREGGEPCGNDDCVAERARRGGAEVGLRITVIRVAAEVSVSISWVDARTGQVRWASAQGIDVSIPGGALFARTTDLSSRPRRRTQAVAWTLTGTALVLGIGGLAALWHADSRRDEFFDDHVDANGSVYGTTVDAAKAHESTTRQWQIAGALLLTGAGAAGIGAVTLMVRDDGGTGGRRDVALVWSGHF